MRICIDARPLREVMTGLGRYAKNLVRHLARIDRKNEYILLLRPLYPGPLVEQENFCEIAVPYRIFSARNILAGARRINRLEADIYHALFHFLPFGVRARKLVITLHDLIWVEHPALAYPDRRRRWFKCGVAAPLIRHALNAADQVITVSESTRQDALAAYALPPAKFTTIHHGVDPIFFSAHAPSFAPSFCRDRPFIFTLSNTLPYKNTARLLRAFALLAPSYPELGLLIAGRGDGYAGLRELSRELGLGERVLFSRQLSYAEVRSCLALARFFAFPSLVEGFGLPVLEAMATGCPVLTSALSSLAEIAGQDAVLVDPGDTRAIAAGMRLLLDHPPLRQRLARRGRERAARFTWECCARETLALYYGLIQSEVHSEPEAQLRSGGGGLSICTED